MTVVISNDPPLVEGLARFTTVPFKPLSDQKCEGYRRFHGLKSANFLQFPRIVSFLQEIRKLVL